MEDSNNSVMLKRIEYILESSFEDITAGKKAEEIISDLSIYYQELVVQNEEMKRLMQENETIKRSYRYLYEDAPAGYVVYGRDNCIATANHTFCHLFGIDLPKWQDHKLTQYVMPDYQDAMYLMMQKVIKSGEPESIEIQMKGKLNVLDVMIITNRFNEPEIMFEKAGRTEGILLRSVITDITELKRRQREVWNRSVHDPLTGIYNRQFYMDQIKEMDMLENLPLSVGVVDIDGLKIINDTLGHKYGDEAIKMVADGLRCHAKPRYLLMRVGGDEIVVLLPRTALAEARRYMQDARRAVSVQTLSGIPLSFSWGAATKHSMEEHLPFIMAAAEDMMYSRKLARGGKRWGEAVNMILESLFTRNKQMEAHSMRVQSLLMEFGSYLKLNGEQMKRMYKAGILHDIGMASISDEILNKAGELTESEKREILRHPEVGGRILRADINTADYAEIIQCHHENWDGTGYPGGLRGEAIPYEARILTIIDTYDRMIYGLNGKGTKYKNEAMILAEIQRCIGRQFDPILAEQFLNWRGEVGKRNQCVESID